MSYDVSDADRESWFFEYAGDEANTVFDFAEGPAELQQFVELVREAAAGGDEWDWWTALGVEPIRFEVLGGVVEIRIVERTG